MKRIAAVIVFCLFLLCSCSYSQPYAAQSYAMDTFLTQTVYGGDAENIVRENENTALRLENIFSVTLKTAELAGLNEAGEGYLGDEASYVFDFAREVTDKTDRSFCYSMGHIIDLWGIGTDHEGIPSDAELKKAKVDPDLIVRDSDGKIFLNGTKLNFGAIVKGYALDCFCENCRKNGAESALIDFGGSICAYGKKTDGNKWTVGIKNPATNEIIVTAELQDQFVSTSGTYERYFERDGKRYHHLIDYATGYPAENGLLQVSVFSDSGIVTDAYSTALFVMGPEKGLDFANRNNLAAVFLLENGSLLISDTAEGYNVKVK